MEIHFNINLKYLRKKNKMSQQDVADKIGVDRSSIGYWESNKSEPTMVNVVKLSELFDVDVNNLVSIDLSNLPSGKERDFSALKYSSLNSDNKKIVDVLINELYLQQQNKSDDKNK